MFHIMSIIKIIKLVEFPETARPKIEFSDTDKIRLDPVTNRVVLKKDSLGYYPVSEDPIYVLAPYIEPTSQRKWLKFEELTYKPDGTSIFHRLVDKTNHTWHWTGSIWEDKGEGVWTAPWNTEQEINENIETLSFGGNNPHAIRIATWLKTVDRNVTPKLQGHKLLMEADISFQESWLLRALVPSLKAGIHFDADLKLDMFSSQSYVDLAGEDLGGLNIKDCAVGYDLTDDPNLTINIVSSYDPVTKRVTFTGSITSEHEVLLRLECEPEVAITTGQDYTELAKVPALILDDLTVTESLQSYDGETIKDKVNNEGWQMAPPLNEVWSFLFLCITDKLTDQLRLANAIKSYFRSNPILHWDALDVDLDLVQTSKYSSNYRANLSGVIQGECNFQVKWVPNYLSPGGGVDLIKTFNLTMLLR